MTKPNKLLLVSTFRHYFIGLGLALSDKSHAYHLVFIDQKYDDERNPIYLAALEMVEPFSSVECMPVRSIGLRKSKVRSMGFDRLKTIIGELKPVEIATGNDRRLEFQYAMYVAKKLDRLDVAGAFLDDGTGSYISFQKLKFTKYLSDKWIDTPIKKVVYGHWYTRPLTFGESHWVDICYLAHPLLVENTLRNKKCIEIEASFYRTVRAQNILRKLIGILCLESQPKIKGRSVLLTLPHSSIITDIYGSLEGVKEMILAVTASYENVCIKYHPRETGDPFNLSGKFIMLPAEIPVEIFFSVMNFDQVIGDVSTALMSAKWLLPKCEVSFIETKSVYTNAIKGLFSRMDILPLEIIINPSDVRI